jgi:hypothetical protein
MAMSIVPDFRIQELLHALTLLTKALDCNITTGDLPLQQIINFYRYSGQLLDTIVDTFGDHFPLHWREGQYHQQLAESFKKCQKLMKRFILMVWIDAFGNGTVFASRAYNSTLVENYDPANIEQYVKMCMYIAEKQKYYKLVSPIYSATEVNNEEVEEKMIANYDPSYLPEIDRNPQMIERERKIVRDLLSRIKVNNTGRFDLIDSMGAVWVNIYACMTFFTRKKTAVYYVKSFINLFKPLKEVLNHLIVNCDEFRLEPAYLQYPSSLLVTVDDIPEDTLGKPFNELTLSEVLHIFQFIIVQKPFIDFYHDEFMIGFRALCERWSELSIFTFPSKIMNSRGMVMRYLLDKKTERLLEDDEEEMSFMDAVVRNNAKARLVAEKSLYCTTSFCNRVVLGILKGVWEDMHNLDLFTRRIQLHENRAAEDWLTLLIKSYALKTKLSHKRLMRIKVHMIEYYMSYGMTTHYRVAHVSGDATPICIIPECWGDLVFANIILYYGKPLDELIDDKRLLPIIRLQYMLIILDRYLNNFQVFNLHSRFFTTDIREMILAYQYPDSRKYPLIGLVSNRVFVFFGGNCFYCHDNSPERIIHFFFSLIYRYCAGAIYFATIKEILIEMKIIDPNLTQVLARRNKTDIYQRLDSLQNPTALGSL